MRKALLIFIFLLLAGCKQVPLLPALTPYKVDVQQGNYVDQEMVSKLKPGMTRAQVRFILGTPLVVDPFRNDRWDYVYVMKKGGQLVEQRRIAVIFEDDKLKRVEGDVVAAGMAAPAAGGSPSSGPGVSAPSAPSGGVKPAPETTAPEKDKPGS